MPSAATPIAVAVVQDADRFLIGPREGARTLAGFWEFPGGRLEPGESVEEAARRECWEETGLCVQIVGEYLRRRQGYAFGTVDLHFLACRPLDLTCSPRPPFRWVLREELIRYRFPAGNLALIETLLAGRSPPARRPFES